MIFIIKILLYTLSGIVAVIASIIMNRKTGGDGKRAKMVINEYTAETTTENNVQQYVQHYSPLLLFSSLDLISAFSIFCVEFLIQLIILIIKYYEMLEEGKDEQQRKNVGNQQQHRSNEVEFNKKHEKTSNEKSFIILLSSLLLPPLNSLNPDFSFHISIINLIYRYLGVFSSIIIISIFIACAFSVIYYKSLFFATSVSITNLIQILSSYSLHLIVLISSVNSFFRFFALHLVVRSFFVLIAYVIYK